MENKIIWLTLIVAVIALAGVAYIIGGNNTGTNPEETKTITVSGEAMKKVAPDLLEVTFTITSLEETAELAENKNAEKVEKVTGALLSKGITKKEIETNYFSIQPSYEWVYEDCKPGYYTCPGKNVFKGYQAVHSITVKTAQKDLASKIIDAASSAENTTVDYVQFTLKEETSKALRDELTALAAADAKKKAEGVLSGLGAKPGKIVSINTNDYRSPIYYAYQKGYAMGMEDSISAAMNSELFPKEQTVTSTVSVQFEIVQ